MQNNEKIEETETVVFKRRQGNMKKGQVDLTNN